MPSYYAETVEQTPIYPQTVDPSGLTVSAPSHHASTSATEPEVEQQIDLTDYQGVDWQEVFRFLATSNAAPDAIPGANDSDGHDNAEIPAADNNVVAASASASTSPSLSHPTSAFEGVGADENSSEQRQQFDEHDIDPNLLGDNINMFIDVGDMIPQNEPVAPAPSPAAPAPFDPALAPAAHRRPGRPSGAVDTKKRRARGDKKREEEEKKERGLTRGRGRPRKPDDQLKEPRRVRKPKGQQQLPPPPPPPPPPQQQQQVPLATAPTVPNFPAFLDIPLVTNPRQSYLSRSGFQMRS